MTETKALGIFGIGKPRVGIRGAVREFPPVANTMPTFMSSDHSRARTTNLHQKFDLNLFKSPS